MLAATGSSPTVRFLLICASIVVVVAGLRAFSETLNAIFIAALIAMLCTPLQNRLHQRGLSRGVSLTLVLLLIVVLGLLFILFVAVSTNQVIRKLPDYQTQLQQLETSTWAELDRLGLSEQVVTSLESVNVQSLIPLAGSILRGTFDSLGNVLLVFLILFYMLMDAPNIPRRLKGALGEHSHWFAKANTFISSVQRYMLLKTVFGIVIALIQTIFMLLIGVDFAVQWGLLAVITNYIPNVGFVLGLIPPVVVTLLEKGPLMTIVLIVVYSLINNVIENFVAPRFVGEELGISTLFIFLSLIFWTFVLGAGGALLAVPLTLLVKIMFLDGNEGARGLTALISEGGGAE
ncbi:MAG: AI-2E family transporter [Anaerolineae bacterium]